MFGVLIGMGRSQPTKNAERIIFITIAVLSIIYTGNFFSTLENITVSGKEKELNTYENINKSQISVCTTVSKKHFDNDLQIINKMIK